MYSSSNSHRFISVFPTPDDWIGLVFNFRLPGYHCFVFRLGLISSNSLFLVFPIVSLSSFWRRIRGHLPSNHFWLRILSHTALSDHKAGDEANQLPSNHFRCRLGQWPQPKPKTLIRYRQAQRKLDRRFRKVGEKDMTSSPKKNRESSASHTAKKENDGRDFLKSNSTMQPDHAYKLTNGPKRFPSCTHPQPSILFLPNVTTQCVPLSRAVIDLTVWQRAIIRSVHGTLMAPTKFMHGNLFMLVSKM